MTGGDVYEGLVTHQRFKPVSHSLSFRVFSFLLDLDRLDALAANSRWFSRNRFNLFSFYDRDHGDRKGADIAGYIRATLREFDIEADGKIELLCYPRMLGYAFNPLSVYFCHDSAGKLTAILYEVRNTFGERHSYLFPIKSVDDLRSHETEKRLHVSPFNEMDLRYRFKIRPPADNISIVIDTNDDDGVVLNATFKGRRSKLSDRKLLGLWARCPLMTLKVIVGIHLEAIKLFAKGMRLRKGAPAPTYPVTFVGHPDDDLRTAA